MKYKATANLAPKLPIRKPAPLRLGVKPKPFPKGAGIRRPRATGRLGVGHPQATGSIGVGPGGAPAAPPAPAAPTPPPTLPWDSQYESQMGLLRRNLADTGTTLDQEERTARARAGFDPQYANDPFTQAAQLRESLAANNRSARNTLAARGQLWSGSTDNALYSNRMTNEQQTNTARQGLEDALTQVTQRRLAAQRAFDEGSVQAQAERLQNALQQDPEAIPGDATAAAGAAGAQAPKGGKKGTSKKSASRKVPKLPPKLAAKVGPKSASARIAIAPKPAKKGRK